MFASRKAVKYIKKLIDDYNPGEGSAPKRIKIEQAIEFMYYQGSISKRKRIELEKYWLNKNAEKTQQYYKESQERWDREDKRKAELLARKL